MLTLRCALTLAADAAPCFRQRFAAMFSLLLLLLTLCCFDDDAFRFSAMPLIRRAFAAMLRFSPRLLPLALIRFFRYR